jgi:hypothetical protein
MADSELRERYLQVLVDHVVDDEYPSQNQMNLVESLLPPEQMDVYLDTLLQKVESVRYPSVEMLARIQRLVARYPVPQPE